VGEDCLLTAGLVVAGSTRIGNRVIASGQTGILDHLKIADGVVLLHRAAVLEDIDEPGMYAGNPAMPLQPYLKNMAIFRNLNDLRKKVAALEKDGKTGE
jgi:UDP-3-O-[3-hydroxymyristoyl] glucosamine N-acyltransferase